MFKGIDGQAFGPGGRLQLFRGFRRFLGTLKAASHLRRQIRSGLEILAAFGDQALPAGWERACHCGSRRVAESQGRHGILGQL